MIDPHTLVQGNERRLAFRRSFTLYPTVLRALASQNCSIKLADDRLLNVTPGQIPWAMQVFAATFALRLFRTRLTFEYDLASGASEDTCKNLRALELQMIDAVHAFRDSMFPTSRIVTSNAHMDVLKKIETDMVGLIFEAFATDAIIDNFEEDKFWQDLFRGIADNGSDGMILMRGFQAGWLLNMPLFIAALKKDLDGEKAPAVVMTHPAPEASQ